MGRDSGGGEEVIGEEGGGGGGGGSRLARLLVLEKEIEETEERKLKKREEGMFQRLGARLRGSFRKLRTEMVKRRGEEEEKKMKKWRRGKSEEEGSELCESEIQPSGRDSAYFSLNMSLSGEEDGEEEMDGSCLDVREGSVSPAGGGRCSDILVRQIRDPGRDPRAIGTLPYGCTRDLPFGLHLQGPHPVRCIIMKDFA